MRRQGANARDAKNQRLKLVMHGIKILKLEEELMYVIYVYHCVYAT